MTLDRQNNPPSVVTRATSSNVDRAATSLATAFSLDPFFRWLLDGRDGGRLEPLFRKMLALELTKAHHVVDIVDEGVGVALWYDVDRWQPTKRESAALVPAAVRAYGKRLPLAGKAKEMVDAVHPREPHRHLAYIGVDTPHQGRGLGYQMLQAATDRCDADQVAAYLENLNPRNAPLYHRAGFVDRGMIELPKGAPPMMAMWRDPK